MHFRYILLSDPVHTVGYSYAPRNLGECWLNEDVVKLDLMMSKIKVNWSKFLTIRWIKGKRYILNIIKAVSAVRLSYFRYYVRWEKLPSHKTFLHGIIMTCFSREYRYFPFKDSSDQSHFIFEINVGMSRIWHTTTQKLNDEFLGRLKIDCNGAIQNSESFFMSDPILSDIDFKNKMNLV